MQAIFTHLSGGKQGQAEKFDALPVRIGRSSSNDLILTGNDTRASSRHAEVHFDGNDFYINDLKSTNGTFVNGLRVSQAKLQNGDTIEFGLGGPRLCFGYELTQKTTEAKTLMAASEKGKPPPAPDARQKEFGRETVQLMLNKAVKMSSRRWKFALTAAILLIIAASSVVFYQLFLQRRIVQSESRAGAATSPTMSFSDIAARNQRSIVLIYNKFELYDKSGKLIQTQISSGSGFISGAEGVIVTNRHVIEPWRFKTSIRLPGNSDVTGKIKQLGVFFANDPLDSGHMQRVLNYQLSEEADVAVLKINPTRDLEPVESINDKIDMLKQGDEIAVLAFPLGLELNELTQDKRAKTSFTRGIVSKIPDNKKQIQLDVAAYEGSSGGPIFNSSGQVIGLLTSGPNDTLNFGTPIAFATKMLRSK